MPNLKETKGTYKELIGQCMFKLTRNYAVLSKFWSKKRYFDIFGKYLTRQQMEFLNDYWYSVDAMEIIPEKQKTVLYEIRTDCTPETSKLLLYEKAIKLGFQVKIALVCLHENWDFSVQYFDFSRKAENSFQDLHKYI